MYNDRGIIKWAPFDALNGFQEAIALHKYNMNKIDKPVLSEDQFDVLNVTLVENMKNNSEIEIYYFQDGYIKNTYGYIKKVDYVFKQLILKNGLKIDIEDIVNLINIWTKKW